MYINALFQTEQLEHFRKHMEAGEPSISTNMSEDENEEESSTGEEESLKCKAHLLIICLEALRFAPYLKLIVLSVFLHTENK